MHDIRGFQGPYRWLSNFWPAVVVLDNEIYPTVEHAYQAAKTLDMECRKNIREMDKPGEAKRYGRRIPIRNDWDDIKLKVMKNLIKQKFDDVELENKLKKLRNSLIVEDNKWGDTFWGVCNGKGENHLGKIIMEVRDNIRDE